MQVILTMVFVKETRWMATLEELRGQLDVVDDQIVKLYEERMKICEQVGEYKVEAGRKVFDRVREKEKLQNVASKVSSDFDKKGIQELYQQLMSMSRKLQYQQLVKAEALGRLPFIEIDSLGVEKARVVFQGAEGAYSQAAMMRFFGERIDSIHVDSFRDAMSAIEEGSAEFAVLPIENSTAGIVSEIYDLLVEFENYIVGEQILKIEHCLLGVPGTKISDIQTVYSHPQSLMQSSRFLGGHSWQQISMPNNAFAARKVAEDRLKTQAAIASEYAGKVYGLEVLQKPVNNVSNNSTRFIIVTNQKIFKKNAKKISICFELPHKSGSLYNMLGNFIYNGVNMRMIESRPILGRNWEYRFFVDIEGNLSDPSIQNALKSVSEEAANMRILGNY